MKTVGLTFDLKTDYKFKKGDPLDANAEFDHPDTINVIAEAIAAKRKNCPDVFLKEQRIRALLRACLLSKPAFPPQ